MPDQGKELGADLYRLLTVGKDSLPSVAAVYTKAKNAVGNTTAVVGTAMARPAFFGGNPVHDAWTSLRDTLSRFLGETESSLDDTGAALVIAVGRYAGADAAAAAELARLRNINGEPGPQ